MPNICLQFGQCGGQLGYQILDNIYKDTEKTGIFKNRIEDEVQNDWFQSYEGKSFLEARAIVVDTEVKVFADIQNKLSNKKWKYNRGNIVLSDVGGSGNNWAKGYFENGPKLADEVIERVRKENEKIDHFDGFLSLMSSAGGTGSGVGTYICEMLRDLYPKKVLATSLILPNANGEVTVQNYNTIMSMSKLYESCDAIITYYNDYLQKICSGLLQIKHLDYDDLNKVIAGQISCIFNGSNPTNCLGKILPLLTAHPDYKLLNTKATPYYPESSKQFEAPLKWEPILRHLRMMLVRTEDKNSPWDVKPYSYFAPNTKQRERTHRYFRSISTLISCCGNEMDSLDPIIEKLFSTDDLFVPWVSDDERCYVLENNRHIQNKEKFSVLLSNNGMYNDNLNEIVDKAWNGFVHQAYTHHFYNNGSCAEDFVYTFAKLENVVKKYKSINSS